MVKKRREEREQKDPRGLPGAIVNRSSTTSGEAWLKSDEEWKYLQMITRRANVRRCISH